MDQGKKDGSYLEDWKNYKPEDFIAMQYDHDAKLKRRAKIKKEPKLQKEEPKPNQKICHNNEAWRRWAKVNGEIE